MSIQEGFLMSVLPWQRRKKRIMIRERGHPPIYEEALYFALSLFQAYFNLTFRAKVSFYQDPFPSPSFQALHWFLKEKASSEQIKTLFIMLRDPLSPQDEPILILEAFLPVA